MGENSKQRDYDLVNYNLENAQITQKTIRTGTVHALHEEDEERCQIAARQPHVEASTTIGSLNSTCPVISTTRRLQKRMSKIYQNTNLGEKQKKKTTIIKIET